MTDPFDIATSSTGNRDLVTGGRYRLPDPFPDRVDPAYKRIKKDAGTDRATSWMRATRLAGAIADSYALSQWSQRHAMKGITLKQELFDLAVMLDPERDKEEFNQLAERAKKVASANERAHLGTQIHDATEQADRGLPFDPAFQPHVKMWQDAIAAYGIEIVDIEEVVVVSDLGVAGRHDRIGRTTRPIIIEDLNGQSWEIPRNTYIIVDLKTGKDLSLAWHEIAIQLALYANADLRYVWQTRDAYGSDVEHSGGHWYMPRAPMSRQVAIVIHIPGMETDSKKPWNHALWAVDIGRGWQAALLARDVLRWHALGALATPMAPPLEVR